MEPTRGAADLAFDAVSARRSEVGGRRRRFGARVPRRRIGGARRVVGSWAVAALAASWAMPATAAPISVRDDRGIAVALPRPPARIVSLLPSLTESVCALGGCARLVGVDRFSDWPPAVIGLPKLGGLDDPPIERIVALRPDVVLASGSARAVERLESLGLHVLVLRSDTRADVERSLRTLAVLLGAPEAAQRVVTTIAAELDRAVAHVPRALRGQSVYFEVDPAPYAAGAASFIGEMLDALGLVNAVPAALGPFPKLNPEYVLRLQPALVMGSARELAAMPERPGWSGLRALQAGRVCGFGPRDYELLLRPGPRIGAAAGVIADCLAALDRPPSGSPRTP